MIALHPHFVTDEHGTRLAVMLPANEYAQLLEELEDIEDLRAYEQAKTEGGEPIPYEQVRRELGLSQ